ncbi:glycosyltransferase family 4 protein [Chitinophaga nivalis]|uniref:Glycosyltransferase family 4 protein n=1 Tax=Chitinophaga nivalis TaxID=2991709 RepID=A0ABT3IIK8_9BACT|nr:glycosyltransferase family 4 protein [Chitinophaga nivalis]MCW3466512.1 glycosyltransferase family 4 protein [Chitinophaga nivalis]MCW3483797.1 glycosyltransferase family 4 protein [Chitinophaga nivalis]
MAKILWIIHNYPPYQNAGAEWMAKEINDYLAELGHEIIVISRLSPESEYNISGSRVVNTKGAERVGPIKECDIIFTHLDDSYEATDLAQEYNKPIVHVLHHSFEIDILRKGLQNVFLVYNSEWVKKDRAYPHPGIVVRPPINPARFKGMQPAQDGFITLVNCNKDKGGLILQHIARAMPDKRFLGVLGAHGQQYKGIQSNITYWDTKDDIREVFAVTSLLIAPSIYESYGRIAIEAIACGIPVVAADTPGLHESLGDAGVFVRRNNLPAWIHAIRSVVPVPSLRARAQEVWENSQNELNQLNNLINYICNQHIQK